MKNGSKKIRQKILAEFKKVLGLTLYFFAWIEVLMLLKRLMLADYNIEFSGLSIAIFSALIMSKAVLLMDLVPLGSWVKKQPIFIVVGLRTFLYTLGVLIVFLLERAFEARHEHGGFIASLSEVFYHPDIHQVWASTIIIGISLIWFFIFRVLQLHLNRKEMNTLFFKTSLEEIALKHKNKTT